MIPTQKFLPKKICCQAGCSACIPICKRSAHQKQELPWCMLQQMQIYSGMQIRLSGCNLFMSGGKQQCQREPTCNLDKIRCQAECMQLLLKQKAGVSWRLKASNSRQCLESQAVHRQPFLAYRMGYEEAYTRVCSPLVTDFFA